MTNNLDIVNAAVTLIIKAALLAARFSGRARKRSLKRLSKMDINDKDKEIIFLSDKVDQQQMQITILQKGLQKKHTNKRYTLREKLFILCYMETFQMPRYRVKEKLGIAKSTLYEDAEEAGAFEDNDEDAEPTLSDDWCRSDLSGLEASEDYNEIFDQDPGDN